MQTATQEIEEEEIAHLNEFHAGVNPSSVRESWQPMLEKGKIAGLENIQQPVVSPASYAITLTRFSRVLINHR